MVKCSDLMKGVAPVDVVDMKDLFENVHVDDVVSF